MAKGAIRCTGCNTPLTFHCPDSNVTCTWLACLNPTCRVRYLDTDRGLIQHTDGTVIGWADMPTTTEPPAVTIEDNAEACRHCGRLPETDGDHTCPCPHPDDTCPAHGRPPAPDA